MYSLSKYSLMLCFGAIASSLLFSVSAVTIDDFEAYASSGDLTTNWSILNLGGPTATLTLAPTSGIGNSKALQVAGTYGFPGIFVQQYNFSSAQDWSSASSVQISYKGTAGNPSTELKLQLLKASGGAVVASVAIPTTTANTAWQEIQFVFIHNEIGLDEIIAIQLVVGDGSASGTISMLFDNLEITLFVVSVDLTVTETGGSTAVTENGASDSISVSISSMPSASVTVAPIFDTEQLEVTPSSRTITSAGWETPVAFTISALDDNDIEGAHSGIVRFETSSGDANFDELITSNITVAITDDDFLITPSINTNYYNGTNLVIEIDLESNQQYTVEEADNPGSTNWTARTGAIPGILSSPLTIPITINTNRRVFRVATEPYSP